MFVTNSLCCLCHNCLILYPKITSDRFLAFLAIIPKKSLHAIATNAGK
ncbi:hypothetical protein FDUTEX481_01642 [Tolypothrix sp. PCC 7601]|nr:hypothetical protein FDUTEX481_01642 [Tolypothrix sp. PCC 7601]